MSTIQIIGAAVSCTAATVSVAACVAGRRALRKPVEWEFDGGMLTFDRKLTEEEIERFKVEWNRRHGGAAREVLNHEEDPSA